MNSTPIASFKPDQTHTHKATETASPAALQTEASELDTDGVGALQHDAEAQLAAVQNKAAEIAQILDDQTSPLTETEATDLAKLTTIVKTAIDNVRLGNEALREIRDRRLYRASHSTFEVFCQEVLGLSEQRISQILKGAEEVASLEGKVPDAHIPSTERAIRELRRVKNPQNKAEILRIAAESSGSGKPTSSAIQEARVAVEGEPKEKTSVKAVKIKKVLKAALLVKSFVETQNLDDLKVSERKQLNSMIKDMAKGALNQAVQAA